MEAGAQGGGSNSKIKKQKPGKEEKPLPNSAATWKSIL
jgi:hypothetical protein